MGKLVFEGEVVEVGVSRLFLSVEMFIHRQYNKQEKRCSDEENRRSRKAHRIRNKR